MTRRSVLAAMAMAAASFLPVSVASAQPIEEQLPSLIDGIRGRIEQNSSLEGVNVDGGEIARRALASGRDLRLRAAGATLEQRVQLYNTALGTMMSDRSWSDWLNQYNGLVVLYDGPPTDVAQLIPVSPTTEEAEHIDRLLGLVQDEIEQNPALGGALVFDAIWGQRGLTPGRELWVAGKLANDQQRGPVDQLFVEAMAADPYWRERRGEVYVSLRNLSIAPLSPVLEARYYTMGLNEFFLGNYYVANQAFLRALAENPTSRILRYWRVVGLIAVGELHRAERKLRIVMNDDPWGQYNGLIARELERIQGPVRWTLQDLEERILLTLNR